MKYDEISYTQLGMTETARLVVLGDICSWWQNFGLAQLIVTGCQQSLDWS